MRPVVDNVELVPPAPGRNLDPRAFLSPQIYEVEQRAIFAKAWVHVCDTRDVPNPGDYATGTIGRTPVLIVRDRKTGELRGFLNACRHRGAQLLDGQGQCDKQIKCPYHAWSYGLDGALLGVPYREQFDCDASKLGLVPIRIGVAGPLIFGSLDPAGPSLAAWLGEFAIAVERTAGWELAFEVEYEIAANWKLFVENANDGYHIPFVHDVLTEALVPDSGVTTLEPHSAYTIARINPGLVPPGFDPAEATIRFGSIFPNLIPVISPSDLTYLRIDPLGHDRLKLKVRSYDQIKALGLPEGFRDLRKAAAMRTTDQDIAVVERTFRGLHAEGLPAGIHASELEARIGHFERTWATAMAEHLTERADRRHLAVL